MLSRSGPPGPSRQRRPPSAEPEDGEVLEDGPQAAPVRNVWRNPLGGDDSPVPSSPHNQHAPPSDPVRAARTSSWSPDKGVSKPLRGSSPPRDVLRARDRSPPPLSASSSSRPWDGDYRPLARSREGDRPRSPPSPNLRYSSNSSRRSRDDYGEDRRYRPDDRDGRYGGGYGNGDHYRDRWRDDDRAGRYGDRYEPYDDLRRYPGERSRWDGRRADEYRRDELDRRGDSWREAPRSPRGHQPNPRKRSRSPTSSQQSNARPASPLENGDVSDINPYRPRKLVRPTQRQSSEAEPKTAFLPLSGSIPPPPSGSPPPQPSTQPPSPPTDRPPTPPLPPASMPPPIPAPPAPDAPEHHDTDGARSGKPRHRGLEATKSLSRFDQGTTPGVSASRSGQKIATPTGPREKGSYNAQLTPRIFRPRTADEEFASLGRHFMGTTTLDSYDHGVKLGEGTFGVVTKAVEKVSKQEVALKKLIMHNERDGVSVTTIREIKILKALDHPNVVPIRDMVVDRTSKNEPLDYRKRGEVFMVFPYMDHDLCGLLGNQDFKMSHSLAKLLFKQILEGMAYIHASNIIHRDIKTANILVNKRGTVMIADFGLARSWAPDEEMLPHTAKEYTNMVVTRWYRAPELLLGDVHYGPAVDMWSLGCVLGEMYHRQPILAGESDRDQLYKIFSRCGPLNNETFPGWNALPGFPDSQGHPWDQTPQGLSVLETAQKWQMDRGGADLMMKLLRLDPKKRFTAEEALEHPWFVIAPKRAVLSNNLIKVESSHEMTTRQRNEPVAPIRQPPALVRPPPRQPYRPSGLPGSYANGRGGPGMGAGPVQGPGHGVYSGPNGPNSLNANPYGAPPGGFQQQSGYPTQPPLNAYGGGFQQPNAGYHNPNLPGRPAVHAGMPPGGNAGNTSLVPPAPFKLAGLQPSLNHHVPPPPFALAGSGARNGMPPMPMHGSGGGGWNDLGQGFGGGYGAGGGGGMKRNGPVMQGREEKRPRQSAGGGLPY